MEVKALTPKEPQSPQAVVELLRCYLDKAFSENITFLEITVKINGKAESVNISCHEMD